MTEMSEDAAVLNFPSPTELSLSSSLRPVPWFPFLRKLRMPYLAKLNYIMDTLTGQYAKWQEFAKLMPELVGPGELTLPIGTIPERKVGDAGVDRHPFDHATMVQALTLTNVDQFNLAYLQFLEWPQVGNPSATFSDLETGMGIIESRATMPRLQSLGIALSMFLYSLPRPSDLFKECGRRLHRVVASRLDAGVPLKKIFIKTSDGQLIWSTDYPTMIQEELRASKSHIETKLGMSFNF